MTEQDAPFIRPATKEDIPVIQDIYWRSVEKMSAHKRDLYQKNKEAFLMGYNCHIENKFDHEDFHAYLAQTPGNPPEPDAYIMFSVLKGANMVYIEDLYNASKTCRLGPPLVGKAVEVAQENAIEIVQACVVSGAEKAYREMGFGLAPGAKGDSQSCTMILQADKTPQP